MLARHLRLVPIVALLACGSSDSGDSEDSLQVDITGTVGSSSLTATSAVAWYATIGTESPEGVPIDVRGLQVFISNRDLNCQSFTLANSVMVDLAINGRSVAPGMYDIVATAGDTPEAGEANANYNAFDGQCGTPVSEGSLVGALTLSEVDDTVAGAVNIMFPGGSVRGTFEAEFCATTPMVTGCQ